MGTQQKIPVAAVVGPTATGKTSLAIRLAQHYGGEIVSCDSMQIYQGLSIGTAKPTPEELGAVPHHLIGFQPINQPFSVSDYVALAEKEIRRITDRGKRPFLVGGTGLYARSLLQGISFEPACRDDALRAQLEREAETLGAPALYARLSELDSQAANLIHPNNVKRVIRALEYIQTTGECFSQQAERSQDTESHYSYLMLCLVFRDRQKLYARIDARVDAMLQAGLLEEAEGFWRETRQQDAQACTAAQAIGYKELFPYFEGKIALDAAVENIKRESRRYAKRQITWFKKERQIEFLCPDDYESSELLFREAVRRIDRSGIFNQ